MKAKKIIKRILIGLLIFIVIAALAAYCLFQFWFKPKYADQILGIAEALLEDEEFAESINEVLEDPELQAQISAELENSADDLLAAAQEASGAEDDLSSLAAAVSEGSGGEPSAGADAPEAGDAPAGTAQSAADTPAASAAQSDTASTAAQSDGGNTVPPQSAAAVTAAPTASAAAAPKPTAKPAASEKSLMETAKENVSPKDMPEGMRLASKVDIGYLSDLSKGGLTAEEKAEAKAHLKSRLSAADIELLKSLVAKYSYLLK